MADNEIKIKVVVDDSQEKKYYSESESRRKKSTAQETEEEKRKTATLKAQLDEKLANLKSHLNREEEIIKQGNRLEIKAAIEKRKILESELRTFEKEHKASLQRQNFDYFQAQKQQAREQALNNTRFAKQKMLPEMGSAGFLSQLIGEQKRFSAGSKDWNNLEVLIQGTRKELKAAGIDVSTFSQKIGGELNNSLKANVNSLLTSTSAYLGLGIAISGVSRFVADSVQQYMKQETALRTLSFAVEKVKGLNNELTGSLVEFANEQQNLTGINDEAIEQAQTYLVLQGRTEEQIKELVRTAIDLSAVQGDLSDENVINNIEKLDATYEGVTGKLGKYDDRIKDLTKSQLENGDAVRILGQKFKGTADEVNKGTEGAWRKWKVGLSESKEIIGGIVVTLVTLNQKFSDWATSASKKLTDLLTQLTGFRTEAEKEYILNFRANGLEQMKQDVLSAIDIIQQKYKETGLNLVSNAKDPEAMSGTKSRETTGSKNSGSRTETQKEILNLVELEQQKLAKLNTQLQANLGHLGSELQLRREILAVELEIFRLRTGQRIDLGKALEGRNSIGLVDAGVRQRFIGRNPRAGNDPRGDMSSEEIDQLLNGIELSFDEIKGIADSLISPFQNILNLAGLTESEFGKMLQMIQTVLNTGGDIWGFISTIAGFIPGGSLVSGAMGAMGGGINPMAGGMSSGMSFNPMIVVNSEVEKTKSVRFYGNTLPEYNRRLAYKTL